MDEALRKKYIPMTETTYYTLLAVTKPRHGYAIMQYVAALTEERLLLGTGTLYTMVGRLTSDGIIEARQEDGKKAYLLTQMGMELLGEETKRLGQQLTDGLKVLSGGTQTVDQRDCLAQAPRGVDLEKGLDLEKGVGLERAAPLDGAACSKAAPGLDGPLG